MDAEDYGSMYKLSFPDGLQTVTVAASVGPEAAVAFENLDSDYFDWFFLKDKSKDTADCKHFVWYGDTIERKEDWLEKELKGMQAKRR